MKKVELRPFTDHLAKEIWTIAYSKDCPEWSKMNAPYFDEYQKFATLEEFQTSPEWQFLQRENCQCIFLDDRPIGMVSKYWIDEKTRWLEFGIIIYDETLWGQGIGRQALSMWISKIFEEHSTIEHTGLTTWSGNQSMIRLAEKLGLKKEAQIRKVRFYQGIYYDSIKYGILKEEWNKCCCDSEK